MRYINLRLTYLLTYFVIASKYYVIIITILVIIPKNANRDKKALTKTANLIKKNTKTITIETKQRKEKLEWKRKQTTKFRISNNLKMST